MHIKMSAEIDKLMPALVKAVNSIEGVAKDNTAGGGGGPKYKYADLSSCLAEARRALSPHGLTVMQPPATTGATVQAENGKGEIVGHTPMLVITTIIIHESGQWMAGEIGIPDAESRLTLAQAIGSMITYMRRYSLCSMLSIPMEDDDGASTGPQPQRQAQRDDRRPYNGGGSRNYEYGRDAPASPQARNGSAAAERTAAPASRQAPARSTSRPAPRDDVPIDDSFGEPPPSVRR